MRCDMCGKESNLFEAIVEGTRLNVCSGCVRYGKKIGVAKTKQEKEQEVKRIIEERSEPEESAPAQKIDMVLPQASRMIKKKREQMNLTQEQLAKKMNEKVSVIQQAENSLTSIALAKKFEKLMNLDLVKQYTESYKKVKVESKEPTIGNMIKFKVRKKK